ncbi:RNA polymerase II C-terminal domain phosphatase-like 4 [Impatiens glandulifera]|uniref:RNA polymerase II C-terminal domain phosphatase-like 4 n=1 Tax=Impatiens glandulifera TaxID=253017 RepID=UPI001FB1210F|nr:RNA polymerase II C-terminal domain phosphatase-like 4 [Impatiens glandulifera]
MVKLNYINKNFSEEHIVLYRQIDLQKTITKKKLYLILDLDQTLLHTITNVTNFDSDEMKQIISKKTLQKNIFFVRDLHMVTKLRPFVFDFLKQANDLFELYIYTMGTRDYAKVMARLIDPHGTLFGWRIISREDCTIPGKKGLDVVLADEKAILIVDDTISVWSNHEKNLIKVDGFNFFGTGKDMEEIESKDDKLANVLCLLKKIHARFFDIEIDVTKVIDRDVRNYLKEIIDRDVRNNSNVPRM